MYRMGAADIEDLLDAGVSEERIDRLTEEKNEQDEGETPDLPPLIISPDPPLQDLT
jgi:hypothetical protein